MKVQKIIAAAAVALVAIYALAYVLGQAGWQDLTEELVDRLDAAREPLRPASYDPRELEGLPPPVQRYFRAALRPGQPIVASVTLAHEGTFDMGEGKPNWKPFTSEQVVATRRPGFVWNATLRIMPGFPVLVHDAYTGGEGLLRVSALGVYFLVNVPRSQELDRGELMRWFAEAAWYPTALLPSQGVRWEPLDDRSARASLVDGSLRLAMTFFFDDEGLIERVRADARGRTVGEKVIPTPWEGRWLRYETRAGMRVPTVGEVAWLLPDGDKPYWRGTITRLEYGFAR